MTYIMDGGTHNDPFNNLNLPTPFPDALQEFKVETSALPARYGHHAASAVNIITKSGTNAFKGSAFEFNRNYHFNARNAFALDARQPAAQPVRRRARRSDDEEQGVLLRRLPGQDREDQSADQHQLHADPRDAERRLHRVRVAGLQRRRAAQPDRRLREQPDRSVAPQQRSPRTSRKYLPVDQADPCGTRAVRHSPTTTPNIRRSTKVDYTLNNQQSVFTRYLYAVYDNPATYDGKNVLTLSRTGQNNQAHSIVVGHNFVLSSFVNALRVTYNKTHQRSPAAGVLHRDRSRQQGLQPAAGLHGHQRHRQRLRGRQRRHQSRLLRFGRLSAGRRRRLLKGDHQISFGGNWIHTKIETLNNRPTNGAFTFNGQGTGLSLADFMMGVAQRRVPAGQSRSTTTTITTTSAPTCRTTGASAPNLIAQRRRALGAVHPAAQHLQLGEPLRSGALRCRASRARSIRRRRPA